MFSPRVTVRRVPGGGSWALDRVRTQGGILDCHGPPCCENMPAAGGGREKLWVGGGASDGLNIHAVPLGAGPVVLNAEVLLKGRGGGGSQQLGPVSHLCSWMQTQRLHQRGPSQTVSTGE